jgi:alginate O-acetyltransferase complex protein AlgI
MAIGLGRLFGFTYPENFNYPYAATSLTGFWRRWHMSLTSWFRDYVYIPLGGNRVSKPRWIFNMLLVWTLTGLWHGAAWNFVLWGLFFGVMLIIEKLLGQLFEREGHQPAHAKITLLGATSNTLRWLLTMFIVIIAWVLFRVEDFNLLGTVFANLFSGAGDLSLLFGNYDLLVASPWLLVAVVACFPQFRKVGLAVSNKNAATATLGYTVTLALYALCIAALLSATYNPFIYFRF